MPTNRCSIVTIARDEDKFIDEWIAYHQLIGIDRFILYDDNPHPSLKSRLAVFGEAVHVVDWYGAHHHLPGRNRQTKAYQHALTHFGHECDWMAFIDVDEFLVLRDFDNFNTFICEFSDASAVTLQWHVFGHGGYYDDPPGLITSSLLKRMESPSPYHKTIVRPDRVAGVESAHSCVLKDGSKWVDANGRPFTSILYSDISARACVNHYHCRSFFRWMDRPHRGDTKSDQPETLLCHTFWGGSEAAFMRRMGMTFTLLRHFVTEIAAKHNELADDYMLKFRSALESRLEAIHCLRQGQVSPQVSTYADSESARD